MYRKMAFGRSVESQCVLQFLAWSGKHRAENEHDVGSPQATFMRRVQVDGALFLHDEYGWCSGGFLADSQHRPDDRFRVTAAMAFQKL